MRGSQSIAKGEECRPQGRRYKARYRPPPEATVLRVIASISYRAPRPESRFFWHLTPDT